MDALHLVSGWSKGAITAPAPIVVKGLLLQGAELQGTTLVEAATDAPEIVLMPSLAIGYAQADQALVPCPTKPSRRPSATHGLFLLRSLARIVSSPPP